MNAHFVLRVATDRDWAADVRAQSFWLEETNRERLSLNLNFIFIILELENVITTCTEEKLSSLPDLMVTS